MPHEMPYDEVQSDETSADVGVKSNSEDVEEGEVEMNEQEQNNSTENESVEAMPPAAEQTVSQTEKSESKESSGKIKFEESLSKSEILAYLEGIVDGLRQGTLKFVQNDDDLELAPSDFMKFRVKASRKKDEEKVSFELEWKRRGERSFEVLSQGSN